MVRPPERRQARCTAASMPRAPPEQTVQPASMNARQNRVARPIPTDEARLDPTIETHGRATRQSRSPRHLTTTGGSSIPLQGSGYFGCPAKTAVPPSEDSDRRSRRTAPLETPDRMAFNRATSTPRARARTGSLDARTAPALPNRRRARAAVRGPMPGMACKEAAAMASSSKGRSPAAPRTRTWRATPA